MRKAQDDAAVRALGGQPQPAGEEMQQIVFGDLNTHQHLPGPPSPPAGLSTLAKLGIGAALISSGAGIGLGVPLVLDALKKPAAVAPDGSTRTIERDYQIGDVLVEPGTAR